MTDEEHTGSCIVCARRDPLPELVPVCGPDRSWMRNQVREIAEYHAELVDPPETPPAQRSEDLHYPPGHDDEGKLVPLASEQLPAGVIPGQSNAPRVGGSREAPVPLSLDRLDLLAAARRTTTATVELTYPEQDDDQIGYLSAATVLDGWCRDIAEARRESVPEPLVSVQCLWLLDRLDWVFVEHPAVDELAADLADLWHALRRATGRTDPKPELCAGVPCKACDLKALYRYPGSEFVECDCGQLYTEDEYRVWVALVTAQAKQRAA